MVMRKGIQDVKRMTKRSQYMETFYDAIIITMKKDPDICSSVIEVDMFEEDINDPDHPEAARFKKLLEEVADEFHCRLTLFEVDHGSVSFSFDSDELIAKILGILGEA